MGFGYHKVGLKKLAIKKQKWKLIQLLKNKAELRYGDAMMWPKCGLDDYDDGTEYPVSFSFPFFVRSPTFVKSLKKT